MTILGVCSLNANKQERTSVIIIRFKKDQRSNSQRYLHLILINRLNAISIVNMC